MISFHHHLRNGDAVLNQVVAEIAAMGLRDITPDLVDFVHRTEECVQCNAAGQVVLKLKTQFQRRLTCTQVMSWRRHLHLRPSCARRGCRKGRTRALRHRSPPSARQTVRITARCG